MNRKYYLIDTENVGNRWFDMPKKIRRKGRIIRVHDQKNLKAIRKDFDKKFRKEPQQKYFKVLLPLIRVIKWKYSSTLHKKTES